MDIRHLEAFLLASELRSFQAAADRLSVSQPTISARIAKLEAEVGEKLFHRTRHPLRPTQKALEILPLVEQVCDAAGRITEQRRDSQRNKRLHLSIGTHTSTISTVVPKLIGLLRDDHPEVDIDLEHGTSYVLRDKLARGALDFCIMTPPAEPGDIRVELLRAVHVKWVAQRGSVPGRRVAEADLQSYTFAMFSRWSSLFRLVDEALRSRGAWPVNLITTDNYEALLSTLQLPRTVGTLYTLEADLDGHDQGLEEIDVGIALPQSQIALCYMNSWRRMNRRRLKEVALQATR